MRRAAPRRRAAQLLLWLLLGAAGCRTPAPPAPAVGAPALALEPADAWYRAARASGQRVLHIDADHSLIAISVFRGGTLARLGHDHLIASRQIDGDVAPDAGRADFRFRVDQLTVDEPALRLAARFDTEPSDDAIAGTRRNMLTKVLEAQRFPLVLLHVERAAPDAQAVRLTITLHGVTRTLAVPTRIAVHDGALHARGELTVLQSEFGITPMSLLGGAIAVQDRLALRFDLVASGP